MLDEDTVPDAMYSSLKADILNKIAPRTKRLLRVGNITFRRSSYKNLGPWKIGQTLSRRVSDNACDATL